jgi:hypothetical protein
MSRIYRVELTASTRRHIHVEDGVRTQLQILDVLPRAQIADLLRKALLDAGFETDPDGDLVRVEADGIEVRIDCEAGQVDVRLASEKAVERSETREVALDTDWGEAGKDRARERIKEGLEAEIDAEAEKLREQVTETLEGRLGDLRVELDKITNRVLADALKIRARQLGEVIEVDDRIEEGAVTIKVRV